MRDRLKYISLPLLVVYFLFLVGCSKEEVSILEWPEEDKAGVDYPKTDENDWGTITYQYNEGVIIIDETTEINLIRIDSDTILYFSKSIPDELKPYVGGIVSSSILNEKIPYGLGNKILRIDEENGLYKCVTTAAPLDDIFKELSLSAKIPLITDTISNPLIDVDGNVCEVDISDYNGTREVSSPKKITINLGNKTHDNGKHLYINGSIDVGASMVIEIDLKKHYAESSLIIYGGLNAEFGGNLVGGFSREIIPRSNIFNAAFTLGPIVLRPYLDYRLLLEGRMEGELSVGVSKQFEVQLGNKGLQGNLTKPEESIIKKFNANVRGEINLVSELDFRMGLYTKNIAIGIKTPITTGFNTDFRLWDEDKKCINKDLFKNAPQLNFNITLDGDAFFVVQLLGKEFVHEQYSLFSVDLFSWSWPLLPTLVEKSLKVQRRTDTESLVYDAEYELVGGLLNTKGIASDLLSIIPSFRVYNEDKEIYHIISEQEIVGNEKQKYTFELSDLEEDIIYEGKPCLLIGDSIYDEKGIKFPAACIDESHPHAVDLALPSGTLWSCCNLGASNPEECGAYYAWGEIHSKSEYNEYNCKTWDRVIHNISGNSQLDAASAEWGEEWCIPTEAQFEELIEYCSWRWINRNGMAGYKVIGRNGNEIFLPAGGYRNETFNPILGENGHYWSSTPDSEYLNHASCLFFDNGYYGCDGDYRYEGLSIRPVKGNNGL